MLGDRLRRSLLNRNIRPQSTLATAQVLLQRFFYVSSLSSYTVNVSELTPLSRNWTAIPFEGN